MWVGGSLLVLRTKRERKREVCECVLLFFLASPSSSSFFLILPPPLPSSFLPRYRPMCAEGKRGGGEEVGSLAVTLGCSPSLPPSLLHSCAKVCLRSPPWPPPVPRCQDFTWQWPLQRQRCEIRQRVHQTSKLTKKIWLRYTPRRILHSASSSLCQPTAFTYYVPWVARSCVRSCSKEANRKRCKKKTLRVYCSVPKQPMETFPL